MTTSRIIIATYGRCIKKIITDFKIGYQ